MVDLDAYFARTGYSGSRAPTLETVIRLHQAHTAAIPFEAIDVMLDRGVDISPAAVQAKLVTARRGGYCFEQNTLFLAALRELGFEAEPLLARVVWMRPPEAAPGPRTHMVLRVTIEGERWLADVGFGGAALPAPIRFDSLDVQPTPHEDYRLADIAQGKRLEIDLPGHGWTQVYEISLAPQVAADFEAANWWTSTHPTSHFRLNLMVSRTTPDARYTLLHNRLTVRRHGAEPEQAFLDARGLEGALRDVFCLPVEPSWRPVIERAAQGAPVPA
jgi:N-hydroxyarylamine O-acetyltransferase